MSEFPCPLDDEIRMGACSFFGDDAARCDGSRWIGDDGGSVACVDAWLAVVACENDTAFLPLLGTAGVFCD